MLHTGFLVNTPQILLLWEENPKNVVVCSSVAPPDTFMDFIFPGVTHT